MTPSGSNIPDLFDQVAVQRNLSRAATNRVLPSFLDDIAASELVDRFQSISRKFSHIAIISHDATALMEAITPRLAAGGTVSQISALTGDGVFLNDPDLQQQAYDCIIACPGLEWTNDMPGSLARLCRALKPDGVLLAAMLGGETLHELRTSWLQAETTLRSGASPRVAPFCDVRDAGGLLQRAGFALPVVDTDRLTVRYDSALALMRELKELGLSNSLSDRHRTLVSPGLMSAACAYYDRTFANSDHRVYATFQMLYLTGWSPDESQPKPLRPGSAKVRLADALKVDEKKLPRD